MRDEPRKPVVNLIVAIGVRGQLGLNGKLPWHDQEDLKWFKQMTMGGVVLVGHNTAKTLPPLPGREVFVQPRDVGPREVVAMMARVGYMRPLWIAGGAKTYERWMPFVDRFYIGRVDYDGPADAWMPRLPF